jgi:hypothetical protein
VRKFFGLRIPCPRKVLGKALQDFCGAPDVNDKIFLLILGIDIAFIETAGMAPDLSFGINVLPDALMEGGFDFRAFDRSFISSAAGTAIFSSLIRPVRPRIGGNRPSHRVVATASSETPAVAVVSLER